MPSTPRRLTKDQKPRAGLFRLSQGCRVSLASVKDRDPKAMKARLDELEAALEEIRAAVWWMPKSTLPAIRHRVALILQKVGDNSHG